MTCSSGVKSAVIWQSRNILLKLFFLPLFFEQKISLSLTGIGKATCIYCRDLPSKPFFYFILFPNTANSRNNMCIVLPLNKFVYSFFVMPLVHIVQFLWDVASGIFSKQPSAFLWSSHLAFSCSVLLEFK